MYSSSQISQPIMPETCSLSIGILEAQRKIDIILVCIVSIIGMWAWTGVEFPSKFMVTVLRQCSFEVDSNVKMCVSVVWGMMKI